MSNNYGKCRSCGARILWVEMRASGRKQPPLIRDLEGEK